MSDTAKSDLVPLALWRAAIVLLAAVVLVGLSAAWLLSTRRVETGTDISPQLFGGWTFGPGASGQATGEGLTLSTTVADRAVYAVSQLVLGDFTFRVRAKQLNGPDDAGYGLVVRHQGQDDFVAMFVGSDGYIAIGQMSSGVWRWRVPWQQWPHIKRGPAENLLRAECRADRCRFYVNDEFAFEVNAVPLQGETGLAVWSPSNQAGVSAQFREWSGWK